MSVSSKFILEQGRVLKGLGRTLVEGVKQKIVGVRGEAKAPGPVLRERIEPPSDDLVSAYVENVGGDSRLYRDHLPAHMWPQWGFGLAAKTLTGLPYPLVRVVNAGARLQIYEELPRDETLVVTAQLVDIDENERRVVLQQKIKTTTESTSRGIVGHLYVLVPLGGGGGTASSGEKKKKREKPRVPESADELERWSLPADAGLDFAKLTGDFNPIHWLKPYAKLSGFPNPILHGFGTMARTFEGLVRHCGDLSVLDVKFTKPLVLPHDVALYVHGEAEVAVADDFEEEAYMTGAYEAGRG